jgi:hypothetical protein
MQIVGREKAGGDGIRKRRQRREGRKLTPAFSNTPSLIFLKQLVVSYCCSFILHWSLFFFFKINSLLASFLM